MMSEASPEPPSNQSPTDRLKAFRRGQVPAPEWDYVDSVEGDEGAIHLAEETISHPENRPLLCLYNMDDEGTILGEVWFTPADLPKLIDLLKRELDAYASGRRWHGEGPLLYFGELKQARER
jgi:hypothetical protein